MGQLRNGQRYCKCGHKPTSHELVFVKGREGHWVKGGMMHVGGSMEANVLKKCSECDCRVHRPESNVERQARLATMTTEKGV